LVFKVLLKVPVRMDSKPQLPREIKYLFPKEIVSIIHSFVPKYEKVVPKTPSPNLQKELTKIQNMNINGKSSNYMFDYDDFCLD